MQPDESYRRQILPFFELSQVGRLIALSAIYKYSFGRVFTLPRKSTFRLAILPGTVGAALWIPRPLASATEGGKFLVTTVSVVRSGECGDTQVSKTQTF